MAPTDCRKIKTLSKEEENANDDGSEKLRFWLAHYFFVRLIRVLFLYLRLYKWKND